MRCRALTARPAIVTVAAIALAACKVEAAPPPASADALPLDALFEEIWHAFHDADDARLATLAWEATRTVDVAALADARVDGFLETRLTADMQARVPLTAPPEDDGSWSLPDPAAARPLFLLNRYACDIPQLTEILIHLAQDELYDDYDTYARTYTLPEAPFRDGTAPDIGWKADATAQYFPVGGYAQTLFGDLRRVALPEAVPEGAPEGAALPPWTPGDFLVTRTFLPFPADFEKPNNHFVQDYQLEVYIPWEGGDILHLYAVWREFSVGGFGDMEGDVIPRLTLNGLYDWDVTTEDLCAEGRP